MTSSPLSYYRCDDRACAGSLGMALASVDDSRWIQGWRMDRVTGYDFFIAHAGADKADAEIFFDLLSGGATVFLDSRCLLPGDNWPERIQEAQLASRATVVLISGHAERAYYLHEEIAIAIRLSRETEGEHRVVPVYLEGHPAVAPYGLLHVEALAVTGGSTVEDIARRLLDMAGEPLPRRAGGPDVSQGRPADLGGAAPAAAARERLPGTVGSAILRKAPRFEKRYREYVLRGLRFIDLKGVATVGPFTPELDSVYVDVSLASRPPQSIGPGVLEETAGGAGRRALEGFLGGPIPALLAVVGGPGSGKTTLLRHTARQACLRRPGPGRARRDLPILLYLRDCAAAIAADPGVTLASLVRASLGTLAAAEPGGWLERKLERGECMILLDGLDEVARQEHRSAVARWAEQQTRLYPGNDYVITSRPHGYRTAGVEGAEVLQVCGFTAAQAVQFLRGWYLAVERHSTGAAGPEVDTRARAGAEDLLRRLDQAPLLRDLTVNPLLLTMIASVHHYRGALPGSRAELYAEICQVMLWRRQEAKSLAGQMSGDRKEAVLRALAYVMMQRRVTTLTRAEAVSEIGPPLRRMSRRVASEDFLADVGSNGLLIEREAEQYSFAHHTFQEYLAAAHIRDKGLSAVLAEAVSDPWWRETTLLYAARSDADPIVEACLAAGTVSALALAFDCAAQDGDLDDRYRERLDGLLASGAAEGADPEQRRLIASVLLARHLHQQVRTADGSRVCVAPITSDIYRLFRADTSVPAPETASKDVPEADVVLGARGADAAAFARWANAVTGGAVTYRLPSAAQLRYLTEHRLIGAADGKREPAVWAMPDDRATGAVPRIWFPPGTPNPHEITAATLRAHVEGDIARTASLPIRALLLRSLVSARAVSHYLGREADQVMIRRITAALETLCETGPDAALALDSGRASAFELALVLPDDKDLALAFARAYEALLSKDLDLARSLGNQLDSARAFADELPAVSSRAPDPVLAPGGSFDRTFDLKQLFRTNCVPVMGECLSEALAMATTASRKQDGFPRRFTEAFVTASGIAAEPCVADPETLNGLLRLAMGGLRDLVTAEGPSDTRPWAAVVADRLEEAAEPVLDRRRRLTTATATSLRLAALCLTGEAEALRDTRLQNAFREIAAGITLLERRASGAEPATEMILLAVE
jgi:hypothetical protein